MTSKIKNLNRRQRKKQHVGEFASFGFNFEITLRNHQPGELPEMQIMDGFVEPSSLTCFMFSRPVGENEREISGYISGPGRFDSATEDHRTAFIESLSAYDFSSAFVSGLRDDWNDIHTGEQWKFFESTYACVPY
jgi:uncharacterized protein YggL (DUF469 family)